MNNDIIVLCGMSSSGKDSLANLLSQRLGYNFVVSHTTRLRREGESEGNPYWFVGSNKFYDMMINNEFIEYRKYNTLLNNNPATWYYGVAKSAIEDNLKYVVVLDVRGMKDFKSHFGNRVKTFYVNVDSEIRRKRAIARGSFDETEWDRRLEDDEKVFADKSMFDYVIDNNYDNIEMAYINILRHIEN